MWLESRRTSRVIVECHEDNVVEWSVDVKAVDRAGEPLTVGRMLADELPKWEIEERGYDVWEVADSDSGGLEAAYASLLDKKGRFRESEFECACSSVIYLYRFEVHPDFSMCRLAVIDSFCRAFDTHAVILAQYHTTWLSRAEFEHVGFDLIEPSEFVPSPPRPLIDREIQFMVRDNTVRTALKFEHYPSKIPSARKKHEQWIEEQGPWTGLH